MGFSSNSGLERVAFGLKCVLHRVRVSQCPSVLAGLYKFRPSDPPPGFRTIAKYWSPEYVASKLPF